MKNLVNLSGAKTLNKQEQKSINGGTPCVFTCPDCEKIGKVCGSVGGCKICINDPCPGC